MAPTERRLAAIMFTDMIDYPALAQQDGPSALHLLKKQRELIQQISYTYKGRVVKGTGDESEGAGLKGWITGPAMKARAQKLPSSESLVEFENALDATRCAVDVQRALRDYNRGVPRNREILLRIAIHVGEVEYREGEVFGEAVAVASRIEPLEQGGETYISEQVYAQVRNKIPFRFVKLEGNELKNAAFPIDVYKLELPWEEGTTKSEREYDRHRLAVLPFANISPDPGDEYFADGMTEELISTLSRIGGLRVTARTSVMGYKAGQKKISEVANELGVGLVLEGSVRKAGGNLRINVQLIDSQTNDSLWVESYDRELRDVFAIQTEVAKAVVRQIEIRLTPQEEMRMLKSHSVNPEAHDAYLRGRYFRNKGEVQYLHKAKELFQQSLEKDPLYARAYIGLADYYSVLPFYANSPPSEVFPKAKAAVAKALELDDSLAEAHAVLAYIRTYYDWNFADADREFQRAFLLNPNDSTVHHRYSRYLVSLGRVGDALKEINLVQELDPLSLLAKANAGMIYYFSREYDSAMIQLKRVLEEDSKFPVAHWGLGLVYEQKAMLAEAISEFELAAEFGGRDANTLASLGHAYGIGGQELRAQRVAQELEVRSKQEYVSGYQFALVFLGLGDKNGAIAAVQDAFRDKSTLLIYMKMDPRFDPLRSDAAFLDIMRSIGLQ